MAVAHLPLDLSPRHERGDRINHQNVDRVGAYQRVDDLQCLLAGIRLRDDQLVDVDAQLLGIDRIERVLGIDESRGAAILLRLGDDVERERSLARAFRPIDLDHAAARQAADAKRDVETERSGRDRLHLHGFLRAQPHGRALAEGAIDLRQGGVERLLPVRDRQLVDHIRVCPDDFE